MLTRNEYNELYRKVEELTDAWEAYVKAVQENDPSRHGKGAVAFNRKEELLTFLKVMS